MKQNLLFIRTAYWAGIIADAVASVQMIFPRLFLKTFGSTIVPDDAFVFAMRYGTPLMVGWTVLLFWADRKPVERRDVLMITAVPVVVGFVCVELYAIAVGLASFLQVLPAFIMQAVLLFLFIGGYRKGGKIEADRKRTQS